MSQAGAIRIIENQHIAVKRCRHGLFAYNVNDRFIGKALDAYGEWCEAELSLLFRVLTPGGVAVDAGANVGTHTIALAKHVTPSGTVFAIEPQRLTFQLLCANVALNALVNVHCLNAVASATSGQAHIPVLNPASSCNFGGLSALGHALGDLVNMIQIDDLQLPRCNLIKIDVEGMEQHVLAGAQKTIRTHRPVLFLENNIERHAPFILSALNDLGYACWWHFAPYFSPENYFGNADNPWGDHQEANVLCYPKEAQVDAMGMGLFPVAGLEDTHLKALRRRRVATSGPSRGFRDS